MPDKKGNLYLFEALKLRTEYDRHIELLQKVLSKTEGRKGRLFSENEDEMKEPSVEFNVKETEKKLKSLQTKRVKLNQEIQKANFNSGLDYTGEKISLAEALEVRKTLLAEMEDLSKRVNDSAYKRIIYKEERDIIQEPKHSFKETYGEFLEKINTIRDLENKIHIANHKTVVKFKDE